MVSTHLSWLQPVLFMNKAKLLLDESDASVGPNILPDGGESSSSEDDDMDEAQDDDNLEVLKHKNELLKARIVSHRERTNNYKDLYTAEQTSNRKLQKKITRLEAEILRRKRLGPPPTVSIDI